MATDEGSGGRVFILGAGSSHFAGFPLAGNLYEWVLDKCRETCEVSLREAANSVDGAMQRICKLLPEQTSKDLELLLTKLDLIEIDPRLSDSRLSSWLELEKFRAQLIKMISWALSWHLYENWGKLRTQCVLSRWAEYVQEGDTLITFNWDLLQESALWEQGKWHPFDGYGFECHQYNWDGNRSKTKILKMHGSVNWGQRDQEDATPAIDYHVFQHLSVNLPSWRNARDELSAIFKQGRYLIIPSYLKDLSQNRLLLDLWNQAYDALVHANDVTVIGYSLPPADSQARLLLASSLRQNMKLRQNTNTFNIRLVLPVSTDAGDSPANQWVKLCWKVGKGVDLPKKTFEKWTATLSLTI